MFLLLLGETMGRDCALVYGVSDRTPSCWGSRVWDRLLRDGGAGGGPSEFASAWARRGALMIAAPACSDAGTDHDLQVPCLRVCRLWLRLL